MMSNQYIDLRLRAKIMTLASATDVHPRWKSPTLSASMQGGGHIFIWWSKGCPWPLGHTMTYAVLQRVSSFRIGYLLDRHSALVSSHQHLESTMGLFSVWVKVTLRSRFEPTDLNSVDKTGRKWRLSPTYHLCQPRGSWWVVADDIYSS